MAANKRGHPAAELSVVSCQLLDQRRQHLLDFRNPCFELIMFSAGEIAQIPRQQKLVLKLAPRSQRDMNKSTQLSIPAATFGNVRRNRNTRPPYLAGKPI